MRDWKVPLLAGQKIIIAADDRFSTPNYLDDQIWELSWEKASNFGLSCQTSYGMRVSQILFFPQFTINKIKISNPAHFHSPLLLRNFAPNYVQFSCSPFEEIDVSLEYWVPESNALTGRVSITNKTTRTISMDLEWCGMLKPRSAGQSMTIYPLGPGHVLSGHSESISPVCYLTGSPSPSRSTIPALLVPIELEAGKTRRVTWAAAGLESIEASFNLARTITARQWDAEVTRLKMQNTRQSIEIFTGDTQWDLALAFSQALAFQLVHRSTNQPPFPSVIQNRLPDQGYSIRRDGRDYDSAWQGITPLDLHYWMSLILPGAPEVAASLLEPILQSAHPDGFISLVKNPLGEESTFLTQPILVYLCWLIEQSESSFKLRHKYFATLLAYLKRWLDVEHDRDQDGVPEWDHPEQSGLEQAAFADERFSALKTYSTHYFESPTLCTLLYQECLLLNETAILLGETTHADWLEAKAITLGKAVLEFQDPETMQPRYRDYQSHLSPAGAKIGTFFGNKKNQVNRALPVESRPVITIRYSEKKPQSVQIKISGTNKSGKNVSEVFTQKEFIWIEGKGQAISNQLFKSIKTVELSHLDEADRVLLTTLDFSMEDLSLYLPLWARLLPTTKAEKQIEAQFLPRYMREFGVPLISPDTTHPDSQPVFQSQLPWVTLMGHGILNYNYQVQAAEIFTRIMNAVLSQFNRTLQFGEKYDTESGFALGRPNSLSGLVPVGLFLQTAGIRSLGDLTAELEGNNPFPWPVTVKYKGMTILRDSEETTIGFPSGETIKVQGEGPHHITLK